MEFQAWIYTRSGSSGAHMGEVRFRLRGDALGPGWRRAAWLDPQPRLAQTSSSRSQRPASRGPDSVQIRWVTAAEVSAAFKKYAHGGNSWKFCRALGFRK